MHSSSFSRVRFKVIILIAVFAGNRHCIHQLVYVLSFKFLVRTQTINKTWEKKTLIFSFHQFLPVIRSFLILAVAELPFNCGIFIEFSAACDLVMMCCFPPWVLAPGNPSLPSLPFSERQIIFLMLLLYSSDFWKPLIMWEKNTVQTHIKNDICSLYFYMIL